MNLIFLIEKTLLNLTMKLIIEPYYMIFEFLAQLLYEKIPLLVSGIGQFSKAKRLILDQLLTKTKTFLISLSSPVSKSVLY